MNILDESIIKSQREQLQAWRIHFRAVGRDVGSSGMKDINEILPLLHSLTHPTFFTMDDDFYHPTCVMPGIVLSISMSILTRQQNTFAVSYVIGPSVPSRSAWAASFAF